MAEPATSGSLAAAFVMFISGVTMELLGFDYYALVGAGIGTGILVFLAPQTDLTKRKTIFLAVLSMLFGAIAGTTMVAFLGAATRPSLMLSCLVLAFGMQKILSALVSQAVKKIEGGL